MPGFGVSARYCSRIKGASKAANADRGASTEELNIVDLHGFWIRQCNV